MGNNENDQFKPTKGELRPLLNNIRALKTEIKIDSDDLRELMICFMKRLSIADLKYALLTMEHEYDQRRFGFKDIA